jgi:hypothetical protein
MTQVLPDRAKKPVRIVTMKRLSQKQRTDLIQVGQRMSNLLFNMAQQSKGVPEEWRNSGKELQVEWDAIRFPKK